MSETFKAVVSINNSVLDDVMVFESNDEKMADYIERINENNGEDSVVLVLDVDVEVTDKVVNKELFAVLLISAGIFESAVFFADSDIADKYFNEKLNNASEDDEFVNLKLEL